MVVLVAGLVACSTTRDVAYDTTAIRQVYPHPLPLSLRVQTLADARRADANSAALFRGERELELGGVGVCVNAETHYRNGRVAEQVTELLGKHLARRGLFRDVSTGATGRADYILTGTLRALHGVQEASGEARVGAMFGLIGAAITAGATTRGRVQIALVGVALRDAYGRVVAALPDVAIDFQGELGADAYCWEIYEHVNAKLREAIGRLAVSVERTVRETRGPPEVMVGSATPGPSAAELAQRARERDARERQLAQWAQAHHGWDERTRPVREERASLVIAGVATAISGVAFATAGIGVKLGADDKDEQARALAERWGMTASAADRAALERSVERVQDERDSENALGIGLIAVGGAALVVAVALFTIRPELPEEPARPLGSQNDLRVQALLGPASAGVTLSGGL